MRSRSKFAEFCFVRLPKHECVALLSKVSGKKLFMLDSKGNFPVKFEHVFTASERKVITAFCSFYSCRLIKFPTVKYVVDWLRLSDEQIKINRFLSLDVLTNKKLVASYMGVSIRQINKYHKTGEYDNAQHC